MTQRRWRICWTHFPTYGKMVKGKLKSKVRKYSTFWAGESFVAARTRWLKKHGSVCESQINWIKSKEWVVGYGWWWQKAGA